MVPGFILILYKKLSTKIPKNDTTARKAKILLFASFLKRENIFFETTFSLFLFDLDVDPAEHNDISAHHPDIVEKLKARLETYAATMAEPLLRVPDTVWTKEKKAHMKTKKKKKKNKKKSKVQKVHPFIYLAKEHINRQSLLLLYYTS